MGALVPDASGSGDVLVAPATPAGTGALAIVRLSGPEGAARAIARRLAPGLGVLEPRRAVRGRFVDAEGGAIDEGLVLLFPAPRSATGEEVVELHCHGARAIVDALLAAACRAGARPARPGEFTRRALANGKLDLARAEAVGLLASAGSRGEARRALGLFDGALSSAVRRLREELLDLLAEVEAGLDFAEEVPLAPREAVGGKLARGEEEARRLAGAPLVRSGLAVPTVAILGRPNAGKSTLFNALLGEDRAIVTEHPGTTRDVLDAEREIAGERVRLLDTAGLREAAGPVEEIGIERARAAAREAALVLYLVDATRGATGDDEAALAALEGPCLLVATKGDLPEAGAVAGAVAVSARTGVGLRELAARIVGALGRSGDGGGVAITERHRAALARAGEELAGARTALEAGEEFAAAGLRRALHALGEITGETASEELLDRIFAGFCIGK